MAVPRPRFKKPYRKPWFPWLVFPIILAANVPILILADVLDTPSALRTAAVFVVGFMVAVPLARWWQRQQEIEET